MNKVMIESLDKIKLRLFDFATKKFSEQTLTRELI